VDYPDRGRRLFCTASRLALRRIWRPSQWVPGAKQPVREAHLLPQSSADFKNTCTSVIYLINETNLPLLFNLVKDGRLLGKQRDYNAVGFILY
jgi:hypothetical protein